MPEQLTLKLAETADGAEIPGPLQPVVGQLVTIDEACRIDGSRYTLSWRPDNLAKVGLRHQDQDTTGMVRCQRAATCRVADICAHGKPHLPTADDQRADQCYDHKPYIVGGVKVWAVPVQANQ